MSSTYATKAELANVVLQNNAGVAIEADQILVVVSSTYATKTELAEETTARNAAIDVKSNQIMLHVADELAKVNDEFALERIQRDAAITTSADQITAQVAQVYTTKAETETKVSTLNAAIDIKADQILSTVSNNYAKTVDLATEVSNRNTAIEQSATNVRAYADNTFSTKTALEESIISRDAAIDVSATQVLASVSDLYTKKTELATESLRLESQILLEKNNIQSTVAQTYATKPELAAVGESVTDLQEDMVTVSSNIAQTADSILLSVQDEYVRKEDIGSIESDFSSQLLLTNNQLEARFNSIIERTQSAEELMAAEVQTRSSHIRFNAQGIELGRQDSPFTTHLKNNELAFMQGAHKVASISNDKMYITNAEVINSMTIGRPSLGFFAFTVNPNGNMSLKWHGGGV